MRIALGKFLDNNNEIIYNSENAKIVDLLIPLAYKRDNCKYIIIIEPLI